MGTPPPSPPVVTRVEPGGEDVSVLVGAEQGFTASCDQPATLTFFLGDRLVFTSNPGVQEATFTCASAPLGQYVMRVVASNENGTGETHWNWNVYQYDDCHIPSGAYLDFTIRYCRCGSSDCDTGYWNNAVCLDNAVMRFARAGKSTPYLNVLENCYWMEKIGCPKHSYVEQVFNLEIYAVSIMNGSMEPSFAHEMCAEYLGGDKHVFSNWKFFQYDNLNITRGDWQMPYGTDLQQTKVTIKEVVGIQDCSHFITDSNHPIKFQIDDKGNVTPG